MPVLTSIGKFFGSMTLSKLKLYSIMLLSALVLAFGIWVFNVYKENQLLKYQKQEMTQNNAAKDDSLKQIRAREVKTAAYVRDLNTKLDKKSKEYVALEGRFQSFIDSIRAHGTSIPVYTGHIITISFQGEQGIASYSGYTAYNTQDSTSTWSLSLGFKPIGVGTKLIQGEDGLWKFDITSLQPGVTVTGGGTLDEDTYRRLQKFAPSEPMKHYMLKLVLGQYGGLGAGYRGESWNFGAHYNLFSSDPSVLKNIHVDIDWCPF